VCRVYLQDTWSPVFSLIIYRIGFYCSHLSVGITFWLSFACQLVSAKQLKAMVLNFKHFFESINEVTIQDPYLIWILTELWPFLNLENSILSKILFYHQALRKVEHSVLPTALIYFFSIIHFIICICNLYSYTLTAIQHKYSDWKDYLVKRLTGSRTLPSNFFSKVQEGINNHKFHKDMHVEVVNRMCVSAMRVATVEEVIGGRLRLRYADSKVSLLNIC
jgi:hypothetical protein